jgi:CTP:molybdopterin cytidylyltransferase MocA
MIGTVILAAGASQRFGSPKQLLVHKGQSLVRAAAKAATAAHTSPVIVVLGAHKAQVAAELTRLRGVRTVVNEHWASGLASSLAVGLRALMEISGCDAVLIMLADQPGVDAVALKKMIAAFDADHRIVAAAYADTVGVPAIFGCEHIKELMTITGDKGAGQWLRDHLDRVTTVPLPEAELDIDTSQDAEQLG